jgi:hypothetical protein
MRRPVLLIFSNAMILIVVFALLAQALFIVQRIAVADKLKGHVEVQRGAKGRFAALGEGGKIKTGDVVRTGSDGSVDFKWTDGTRWKLMPNSQITVRKASYNMVKKSDQRQLDLTMGKVFIRIMKALTPASKFEVETPTAVAAVRGTIFSVEVTGGQTKVAVFKGQVKVTSSGASNAETTITPGKEAVSANAGNLQTTSSADADAAFASEPTIVKPELDATVRLLKTGNEAMIDGTTEVNDTVTVDSQPVRILGEGVFHKRLKVQPGLNTFTIVSTDKHGESSTVTRTLTVPAGGAPTTTP